MKKTLAFFLICLISLLVVPFASAQDELNINPETLLETADRDIFTKTGFVQDYSEVQGVVNEFLGVDVIHQVYINSGIGSQLMTSLQPNVEKVSISNKRFIFDEKRAKEFHMSYQMQIAESIPENAGTCWLKYSDRVISGAGRENGVVLYPGDKAYAIRPEDGTLVWTEIADLSDFSLNEQIQIDIIRLAGTAYFYIDGQFVFEYTDEIANPVSFEGGTELFEGMNRIRCTFDNFTFNAL